MLYGSHMNTKTTPERIEALRLKEERSIKWTAEKSGMAVPTFRRKINNSGEFTLSEIARIANALGVEPSALLPEEFFSKAA